MICPEGLCPQRGSPSKPLEFYPGEGSTKVLIGCSALQDLRSFLFTAVFLIIIPKFAKFQFVLIGRLAAVARWRCLINGAAKQPNKSLQRQQGRRKHYWRAKPTSLSTGTRMHANTYIGSSWQDGSKGLESLRGLLQAQHGQGGLVLQGIPIEKRGRMVHRANCLKGNSGWDVFHSRSREIR